jgi:AcrR family transcriptional regulator
MRDRLSRADRKERTRAELVAAAREVFLSRGFHGASLEEISEQAGYTKGAVYSNFAGKNGLFLAVLDAHAAGRARAYAEAVEGAGSMDAAMRALSREMTTGAGADPRWVPVLIEFWTHASRHEELRRQVAERHERNLDGIAPVEALNTYQPEGLVGYPTIAGILAGEQLAGCLRIRPRWGLYGAGPLTPVIRRRIREAWGFEPGGIYAATEALGLGSSTPGDECFEMSEDVLVVEVVDRHDRPVPPGTPGAKVLITNLVNYAQPLIRYELSDVVTLAARAPARCRRPSTSPRWRRWNASPGRRPSSRCSSRPWRAGTPSRPADSVRCPRAAAPP